MSLHLSPILERLIGLRTRRVKRVGERGGRCSWSTTLFSKAGKVNLEPHRASDSPTKVIGTQVLGQSFAELQAHLPEAGMEM